MRSVSYVVSSSNPSLLHTSARRGASPTTLPLWLRGSFVPEPDLDDPEISEMAQRVLENRARFGSRPPYPSGLPPETTKLLNDIYALNGGQFLETLLEKLPKGTRPPAHGQIYRHYIDLFLEASEYKPLKEKLQQEAIDALIEIAVDADDLLTLRSFLRHLSKSSQNEKVLTINRQYINVQFENYSTLTLKNGARQAYPWWERASTYVKDWLKDHGFGKWVD